MLQSILQHAIQCGIFEKNISLEPFKDRVGPQCAVATRSVMKTDTAIYMLCESGDEPSLIILTQYENILEGFIGESVSEYVRGVTYIALDCALDHGNAAALRRLLPWTAPSVLDTRQSFGFGDRIGSPSPATPWHIEACTQYKMAPALAQQSVRENHKTGRTFESVLDDATWSVLAARYCQPWGADADHLKTLDEIEKAAAVGYTLFTLDPSEKIDNAADSDDDEALDKKLGALFPKKKGVDEFIARYEGSGNADARAVVKSGVKYLAAVRHAVKAYNRLAELRDESGFQFEMSIDETVTPTTPLDHRIIATELMLGGVKLFSLAPRFVGRFEKGIDYIGSVDEFRPSLETHAALARELGDYRLSLHSGSDKFSIYPIFGEVTDGYFHVKTAGTSFLEAAKVVAEVDIDFFREILALAIDTFEENAASYDISGDVSRVPDPAGLSSGGAVELITSDSDVRQTLHIAFGVILKTMGPKMRSVLSQNSETYRNNIVTHLGRHIALLTGRA